MKKQLRDSFTPSHTPTPSLRHENIVWLLDCMVSPQRRDFQDVYIVTDLMETDLSRIIESPQVGGGAGMKREQLLK
jgi:hypothetical protein